MKDRKRTKRFQLNNCGSALVTVIIVIAFISILATLILYLSVMNYQMKSTDYKTKVSFYGAEVPLEELRVQMAVDLSNASRVAYNNVMARFGTLTTADLRTAEYERVIWEEIQKVWNDRINNVVLANNSDWCYGIGRVLKEDSNDSAYPKKYHVISGDDTVLTCSNTSCAAKYHVIIKDYGSNQLSFVDSTTEHYMLLQGITVTYTEDEFSSVVSTDLCMNIPEYDWSVSSHSSMWDDSVSTLDRKKMVYEKCVIYLNYLKR